MADPFQKLLKHVCQNPARVTPDEMERLLAMLGYKLKKRPGTERKFHKSGSIALNIPEPKNGKYIKSPWVTRVISLLRLEDRLESD